MNHKEEGRIRTMRRRSAAILILLVTVFLLFLAMTAFAVASTETPSTIAAVASADVAWWVWPLVLFTVTFLMGILAILGRVGVGLLFVPIIACFFPFHLDFVRCAGLLVALAGALAAVPGMLKIGMADLRLALPAAVIASACAIVGTMIGLALPPDVLQTALGATVLAIVGIMLMTKKKGHPKVIRPDALSFALRINGIYYKTFTGQEMSWQIHRTPQGLAAFILVGIMTGMFGLGSGWGNVSVFNLIMGAPLKISVATGKLLLTITDSSAAWIYINNGALMPMIVVPSIIGTILGSIAGVKIMTKTQPAAARYIVILILLFVGMKSLLNGLSIWN